VNEKKEPSDKYCSSTDTRYSMLMTAEIPPEAIPAPPEEIPEPPEEIPIPPEEIS